MSDSSIADRLVNATDDDSDRYLFWYPAAFFDGVATWGVFVAYQSTGRVYRGIGGTSVYADNVQVAIYRNTTLQVIGLPPGVSMVDGLPDYLRIYPQVFDSVGARQTVFACHINSNGVFGVTFPVKDNVTGKRMLAKWDSVDGFGFWGFDFDLDATGRNTLPAVTCYRQQSYDPDIGFYGDPGFVVSTFDEGQQTHVVTAGQVHTVAPVFAGAAMPVGNSLTSFGSTNDAYQVYTAPEEE